MRVIKEGKIPKRNIRCPYCCSLLEIGPEDIRSQKCTQKAQLPSVWFGIYPPSEEYTYFRYVVECPVCKMDIDV